MRRAAPLARGVRAVSTQDVQDIITRAEGLHRNTLAPLNAQWQGPLEKNHDQITKLPFVFLLGNHSSGKSTFINYVVGRQIQSTGVAPTDDAFTIIAPGEEDADQDGPSLVGEPDMGFAGLRMFGPALIHHTQLKVRTGLATQQFMLVDSPGMIDSPAMSRSSTERIAERGYDFEAVTRWFAERADVILLFFDPDKPGTTGETLAVLTSALAGHDHKLHIVLNKVDQFAKIHDFARAYGSLCWNLSKVIHRKDLPRIYTMFVPTSARGGAEGEVAAAAYEQQHALGDGLRDLESARDEIVGEVMKAPERRIDNVITKLHDSTCLLAMHLTVGEAIRKSYSDALWKTRGTSLLVAAVGGTLSAGVLSSGASLEIMLGVGGVSGLATVGSVWYGNSLMEMKEKQLMSSHGMTEFFRRAHLRQIVEGDEFVQSLWGRVEPQLRVALETIGIANMPSLSGGDRAALDGILEREVPSMRRLTSPTQSTSFLGALAEVFLGGDGDDKGQDGEKKGVVAGVATDAADGGGSDGAAAGRAAGKKERW